MARQIWGVLYKIYRNVTKTLNENFWNWGVSISDSQRKVKQASERDFRYQSIMRNLVRRYVTVEQRKAENEGVTEDDVNEIKQDISAFRCELIEILKNSGMNTSTAASGTGKLKQEKWEENKLLYICLAWEA